MIFVWESTKEIYEKPLGYMPCGLSRGRQRPDMCFFTIVKTHEIFESRWDYFCKFLSHTLKRKEVHDALYEKRKA